MWSEIFKGSNFTSESQVMNGVERDAEVEHEWTLLGMKPSKELWGLWYEN